MRGNYTNIAYMMKVLFSEKNLMDYYDIKFKYKNGEWIDYDVDNISALDTITKVEKMEISPKTPKDGSDAGLSMTLNFMTNEITIGSSTIYAEKKDIQYILINLRTCLQWQKKPLPQKVNKSDNDNRRHSLLLRTLKGYEEQIKRERSEGKDTSNTQNEINALKGRIEAVSKNLKTFEEFILMYNGPNYNGVYPNSYPPVAAATNGILAANVMPYKLKTGAYEFVYSPLTDKYYGIDELQDLFYQYVNKCKVNGDDPTINNWDQIALGNIDTLIRYIQ